MPAPILVQSIVADRNLAQVIEPLASYICAADCPRHVLRSALAALFNEVSENHRAARAHVSCFDADSLGLVS